MRASLALCAAFAAGCVAATAAGADSFPDPRNFLYAPPTTPAPVAFALSRTLGDRMVLQRAPASAVVWGFAPPGTSVKTLFAGTSYTSTAGADTVWRQSLPPTPASATGVAITFSASTGATAALNDVLFGDVYVCGGQSNQVFTVTAANNSRAEIAAANDYPSIRLLTVGQKTSSNAPLNDLATLEQPWAVASNISIGGPGEFAYFSAVCWFFAKGIVDALGADAPPMGLVSSNWGGTRIESWMTQDAIAPCGGTAPANLYNAMIAPFTVGPMAVTGFTWYQGESDLSLPNSNNYVCTEPAMMASWRSAFKVPAAFFGIVQLSTWAPVGNASGLFIGQALAQLRVDQLTPLTRPGDAYASNADHGAGTNIHPPYKQYPGRRLAAAALNIVYGKGAAWRHPQYASAAAAGAASATITLTDVGAAGLTLLAVSFNEAPGGATPAFCAKINAVNPHTCAGAAIQFNDAAATWADAAVSLSADGQGLVLTPAAPPPSGASRIVATAYGWGSIPLLTAYRKDIDAPVLGWNRTV